MCIRDSDKAASIRWNLLTAATPQIIDDHTIVLVMDGKKLTIQAEGTVAIKSRTWSTESPHEYDASTKGTIFVGFEFEVPAKMCIRDSFGRWQEDCHLYGLCNNETRIITLNSVYNEPH